MRPSLLVHGSRSQPPAERLAAGEWWIVEMDARFRRDQAPPGTRYCVIEDFLDEDDLEAVDERAARFARRWYHVGGRDVSEIDGISAGEGLAFHLFLHMTLVFKNLELARRVLAGSGCREVLVGTGVGIVGWAWRHAAEVEGVECELLAAGGEPLRRSSASEIRSLLTAGGLKQVLAGTAHQLFRRAPERGLPVLALRRGRATTAAWFSQLAADRRFRTAPLWQGPTLVSGLAGLLRWRPRFRRRWRKHRSRLAEQEVFQWQGRSLWPALEPGLRALFVDRGAQMIALGRAFEGYLRRMRASALVIAWHRLDPLTHLVARKLALPVVGLQDSWLPGKGFPPGYRRFMAADHLLVWGEISAGWCREMPATEVHVAGHPGGRVFRLQPTQGAGEASRGGPLKVLLTHQCWGPWSAFHSPLDTDDTLAVCAEAARRLPAVRFAVKVHPLIEDPRHEGPGRFAEIRAAAASRDLPNFQILPLESSMDDALADCDVVVSYYSLTAVEALCAGKRVIVLNTSGKRDLFPELVEAGAARRAETAGELVALLEELLRLPAADGRDRAAREALDRFLDRVFAPPEPLPGLVAALLGGGGGGVPRAGG